MQLFDLHSCDTYNTCVSVTKLADNATYGMPWCGSNGMQSTMVCCTIMHDIETNCVKLES